MGFLSKSTPGNGPGAHPPRDVAALARNLLKPALLLTGGDGLRKSRLGGLPHVPPGFVWPRFGERPLTFLASIDLAEVRAAARTHQVADLDFLPAAGTLLFFYDDNNQPWGFDPADRDACRVIYLEPSAGGLSAAAPHAGAEPLPARRVDFGKVLVAPDVQSDTVKALRLSDEETDDYIDYTIDRYPENTAHHQMGGFPDVVQNDGMELQCELVSHGLYCGDSTGYNDPRRAELEAGAAHWRLLLQLDTDERVNMWWGDAGRIYFWVRAEEARAGNFDNVWLILQCG
ncbi:MAG: YwqG family protein [Nitrospirota bacterium]|nr:YwqG family protein [Nitrospirota bacterium]